MASEMSFVHTLTLPHSYLARPQEQFYVFQEGRILREKKTETLWVRDEELEAVSTYRRVTAWRTK